MRERVRERERERREGGREKRAYFVKIRLEVVGERDGGGKGWVIERGVRKAYGIKVFALFCFCFFVLFLIVKGMKE